MLTSPHFTPKQLTQRYLSQIFRLQLTARRMGNARVIRALQRLAEKVSQPLKAN